jgi:hypothetical protein
MMDMDWLAVLFGGGDNLAFVADGVAGGGDDEDAYAESVKEKAADEPFELEPELS